MMPRLLVAWILLGWALIHPAAGKTVAPAKSALQPRPEKLVVVLLDGFRWDYVDQQKDKKALPGFRLMHKEGVRAKYVKTIFPSLSYASWTTLSTGLYAENHNIIGNYFYDSLRRETFELFNRTSTSQQHWWQGAEPIWTTATKNGRKVGTLLWGRSDIPYQGILPSYGQGFDLTKGWQSFESNLERTLRMLDDGYDLVMIYNEHIDNKGHQFGPKSAEVRKAVEEIDGVLHRFLLKLKETGWDDKVNVMIVSDHGMTAGGADSGVQYVDIDDYLDLDDVIYVIDRAAVAAVAPKADRVEKVYKRLQQMPGVDVYRREDIPDEYHYKKARYVQDILIVARKNYIIRGGDHPKHLPRDPPNLVWNGFHGYDSSHPDMRTIFMAKGPSFKKHYEGQPIELVDIYQLYAHILAVPPQPNNGTWANVRSYLANGSNRLAASFVPVIAAVMAAFARP